MTMYYIDKEFKVIEETGNEVWDQLATARRFFTREVAEMYAQTLKTVKRSKNESGPLQERTV